MSDNRVLPEVGHGSPPGVADGARLKSALRLVLFDGTCLGRSGLGLSRAWSNGTRLYRALGRIDGAFGASTFAEGLHWLATFQPERPIEQVQFWGHGKWGQLFVGREALDRSALGAGHPHHATLVAVRRRLAQSPLFWFRTCETFGAARGHEFAKAWTDFFGGHAAGHTHVIGYWQSGLHRLRAGAPPHWSAREGLVEGSPWAPLRAATSARTLPQTISCFTGHIPEGW